MITRFDHAVIAVRDLAAAQRTYQSLGFSVSPGGRHPGRGTENAIIRFGLDYLELLAIADEQEAIAQGLNRAALADFLRAHDGGLVGYALAAQNVETDAARLRAFGIEVDGPFAMHRERPDGTTLRWRLAIPESIPWRRPWPFLIEWETPDDERLAREQPGTQPNGATGVWGVAVVVRDLDRAIDLYTGGLGLGLIERETLDELGAERACFHVGDMAGGTAGGTRIDLLAPRGAGEISQALASAGEGLWRVTLTTPDLQSTQHYLASAGIATSLIRGVIGGPGGELLLAPQAALGARLVMRATTR